MLSFEAPKGVRQCNGLSRRDFLRVGALTAGAAGFSLVDLSRLQGSGSGKTDINCILLGAIARTGVSVSHGQSAGFLGKEHEPVFPLGDGDDLMVRLRGDLDVAGMENPHALVRAMDQAQCSLEESAKESGPESDIE